MKESEKILGSSRHVFRLSVPRKYLAWTLFVFVLLLLFSGGFGLISFLKNKFAVEEKTACGDGTLYDDCSETKPYLCLKGYLIENPVACGCPDGFNLENNSCLTPYHVNKSYVILDYNLRGRESYINFSVYEGMMNYISEIPRSIIYNNGQSFSRADFKLKEINEKEQKKFLYPLVVQIQNLTSNKEDQVRIAVSLVQNIPYGSSNKTQLFGVYSLNYSRYPYEVLYDNEGICGEKTSLLAFLLKEMGYGVSFFYYQDENHESLGINCPVKKSILESGNCMIETTGSSIINDDKISYVGIGRLLSMPEIYPISDGESLAKGLYEYRDAKRIGRIRDAIESNGRINFIRHLRYEKLKEKYGLVDVYYGE